MVVVPVPSVLLLLCPLATPEEDAEPAEDRDEGPPPPPPPLCSSDTRFGFILRPQQLILPHTGFETL